MRSFRLIQLIILILMTFFAAGNVAVAKKQSARFSAKVEAGKIYTTRLGNLPEGAKLSIGIESDGDVAVLLLDQGDMAAIPNPENPMFEGRTSDRLTFSLRLPASGDYYLVVDNRKGPAARNFTLSVLASAEPDSGLKKKSRPSLSGPTRSSMLSRRSCAQCSCSMM